MLQAFKSVQDHLWLGRIEEMKMTNYHFCPRHFSQWFKLQICPKHACTCITGPNPFYTPKLNANLVDNGFIFYLWSIVH